LLGFEEKLGQIVEGRFGDPALGGLPPFAGANQAGPGQFLEMVRNGRLPDFQPSSEFPYTKPGAGLRVTSVALAAPGQPEENNEPVGMGEGLEGVGEFLSVHILINIDISLICQSLASTTLMNVTVKKRLSVSAGRKSINLLWPIPLPTPST
jgi:hypothetical protein